MSEGTAVSEIERILRAVAFRELTLIVETTVRVVGAQYFAEEELSRLVSELRKVLSNSASRYGIQELPERSGLQWDFASLKRSLGAIRRQTLATAEERSECGVPVPSFDSRSSIDERGKKVGRTVREECIQGGSMLPDIQGAFIRALHPEGEGDGVDEGDPKFDRERLERMEKDSPDFARMIQRLEEDIFPEGKD